MLSEKVQFDLHNAESYFEEHLGAGDYYEEGNAVKGEWVGEGCKRLNLPRQVEKNAFLGLCHNEHPISGERLTVRMREGRRVFTDFTFSPPKSVSIVALVGGDSRIVEAHRKAVKEALREMEKLCAARVRAGLKVWSDGERRTGNAVCAIFEHDTSRALDPQLHTHCIVFNCTYDPVEERWKALSNGLILQDKRFITEVYRNRLAHGLKIIGYELEQGSNGFEIRRISQELIDLFSKRHEEIDAKTDELLRTRPDKNGKNLNEIRDNIAHEHRSRKIRDVSRSALRELWNDQLRDQDREALRAVRSGLRRRIEDSSAPVTEEAALQYAIEHLFERRSVVRERELWAEALLHGRGDLDFEKLKAFSRQREFLRLETGEVTIREVLQQERDIVRMARDCRGRWEPLNGNYTPEAGSLTAEQRDAVEYLLKSKDGVLLFRGGAGTGKSFALREVKRGLDAVGHRTVVLAPQRKQVNELQNDGLGEAETLASFLQKGSLPDRSVLLVDEAGLIGVRQMHRLLSLARESGSRVILSGDTRQHSSVEAGDALRTIEKYSGLKFAGLSEIKRQREWALKRQYRLAIREISAGKVRKGFERLVRAGAVHEIETAERYGALVEAYLESKQEGKSCLVVSPTWREIELVTQRIRRGLKDHGCLGQAEQIVDAYETLNLTNAQKSASGRFYEADAPLVFNRKVGAVNKNDVAAYVGHVNGDVVVATEGRRIQVIRKKDVEKFTVMRKRPLALAPGDRLLIQANGTSHDGLPLTNGELVTVTQALRDGRIKLEDGRVIGSNFRQFTYGYAVTSHSCQGLTVDRVLIAMDAQSKPAISQKQFYVSASRGRESVAVFTDNLAALRENIQRSGERKTALELLSEKMGERPEFVKRISNRPLDAIRTVAGIVARRVERMRALKRTQAIRESL